MWPPESRRVACSAVGTDLSYVTSVHMFLLCRVKSAMAKTLSVCWDLCSSHGFADEPSIPLKLIVQYGAVVMVVRVLLKVPCKRAEKCETDEKVVKQR